MEDASGDNEDNKLACVKSSESDGDWISGGWRNNYLRQGGYVTPFVYLSVSNFT